VLLVHATENGIEYEEVMSVVILCNKAPEWLWLAVEHISKKIPDEDRNLIKKGWDQLYREPMSDSSDSGIYISCRVRLDCMRGFGL
jgi:hypothetical protein